VITEFKVEVPGNYTLVDHALARAELGLLGVLHVEGDPNPEIYDGQVMSGMGRASTDRNLDGSHLYRLAIVLIGLSGFDDHRK